MAWVTVISILILCPKAIRSLREYENELKTNKPFTNEHHENSV